MQQQCSKGDKPLEEEKEGFMAPAIYPVPSEKTTKEPSQCLPCSHTRSWTEKKDSVLGGWVLEKKRQKEMTTVKEFPQSPWREVENSGSPNWQCLRASDSCSLNLSFLIFQKGSTLGSGNLLGVKNTQA